MSISEKECKWHFAALEENAGDEGPNSAMSQAFSKFPCSALVRESIQNSLDAVVDDNKPLKVCFEYRSLEKSDYKNFFILRDHIQACLDNYSDNPTAKRIYPLMLQYMKNANEIGFIRVSDYNTKGMDYAANATNKTFYAFVRAAGVSVKQAQGSGGSFGFGKGAFFVMSPINTLIVSTKNINNECYFEGVTRLCSHRKDGKKRSHMGFYDNNGGQPISDPNMIPKPFTRQETGTSIGIMGVDYNAWNESKDELVKEVLRKFFVAVLNEKLVVIINGKDPYDKGAVTIDAKHLDELMHKYFPELRDVRGDAQYNPRPYYEAIKEKKSVFETELPTLGHVRAYFKEVPENSTNVIFMRKLYMKVYRYSRNLGNFNGVFICDNEVGNTILGDMENPEHNEWKAENCNKPDRVTDYKVAKQAEIELVSFVSDCFVKLLDLNSTESVQVADLEKYLPSDNGIKGNGEKGNPFYGIPTGKYINEEGASRTTEGKIIPYNSSKDKNKGNVKVEKKGVFKHEECGKNMGGTGGKNNSNGGGTSGPGDNFGKGTIIDENGHFKQLVPVDWRPVISRKKGYMDIVIFVDHDISDAELSFEIGRESQIKNKTHADDVTIIDSTKGVANLLNIKGVDLKGNAKNIIQIAFSDHMSHALNLGVYETI